MAAVGSGSSRDQNRVRVQGSRGPINPIIYLIFFVGICLFIIYVLATSYFYKDKDKTQFDLIRTAELHEFQVTREYYDRWLEERFGASAQSTFDTAADLIQISAEVIPATGDKVSSAWRRIHTAFLRAAFLVVAWWKFWLLLVVGVALWSVRTFKVWFGPDLLGRQTNGRLFYSGIRGDLKKVVNESMPDVQTPGLACPSFVPEAEVRKSALGRSLLQHNVANKTNLKLAAIILKHKNYPAFVAARGEYGLLEEAYRPTALAVHTKLVVEAALSLRETYLAYADKIDSLTSADQAKHIEGPLSAEQYVEELKFAFNRVLTPAWKIALTELSAKELTTIVLAHEVGKVMAYANEGSRFVRASIFPQLCSRSILHSIPEYSAEYSFNERNTIRRAIIYGSRKSVYGPVKFVLDLTPQMRAARQLVELLMASPHELTHVSNEVELYGLTCDIHDAWQKAFIDDLMVSSEENLNDILAHGTMAYVPFTRVIQYFKTNVSPATLNRLSELVDIVSVRQQLAEVEGMATGTTKVPDYLKIYPQLSSDEIASIAKVHTLKPDDIKAWSSLRVVLNYYSWLGRRVGDNKVPDSSIIFLAVRRQTFEGEEIRTSTECHAGMVALRATRLADRWGTMWARKFDTVFSVTAVDNMEEFEKFKRGESLDDIEINSADGAPQVH